MRCARNRRSKFTTAHGKDATALANLVFFRAERHRRVALALRDVGHLARHGLERESIAVVRIGNRFWALHDVQTQVERVAAEDVAHVGAADDHHLEAGFFGNRLESCG